MLAALVWTPLPGCGGDDTEPFGGGSSGGRRPGSSNGSNGDYEELPQGLSACTPTCTADDECRDCPGGQTVCDTTQGLCIACGPNAGGKTCAAGEECSAYGYCIPAGTACPTDANDVPTISCNADADCAACSPEHRVCHNNQCVKCKPGTEQQPGSLCQATEYCSQEGTCERKCPEGCVSDNQCGRCGDQAGNEAHVCTRGACAECNPTRPEGSDCGAGEKCGDNGLCEPKCGDNGNAPLECESDADCSRCGDVAAAEDNGAGDIGDEGGGPAQGVNPVGWSCKKENGAARGKCAPRLSGGESACKALGAQILPKPFSSVSALCEDDTACEGVGVNFNVGGLLGKLTQLPGVQSGVMVYPMKRCAKMEVLGNELPCGICVPCKEDLDCNDINIMESVGSIFGPIGSLVSRVLQSAIFGDDPPIVHMTCSKVFGDFGACVPCPAFFSACGDKAGGEVPDGGTDGGSTDADHCNGKDRGWYCSGLNRATAYFCNGDGSMQSGAYFCAEPAGHCRASGPGTNAPANTVTDSNNDPQAVDGRLPQCSTTEDPYFPSRELGAAQGILP